MGVEIDGSGGARSLVMVTANANDTYHLIISGRQRAKLAQSPVWVAAL